MNNAQIADHFSLLAKLMDIHGENAFKAKSYSSAAFAIDKLPAELSDTPRERIAGIRGIGDSAARKVVELLDTGQLTVLNELVAKTPPGVLEMLQIKGLGPKKITVIWKEMEIETLGELLYACKENRLKMYKGFGEKTQHSVMEAIEFYNQHRGSFLYAQMETAAPLLLQFFEEIFPDAQVAFTGAYKRMLETVEVLELVITASPGLVQQTLRAPEFELKDVQDHQLQYQSASGIKLKIHCTDTGNFIQTIFFNGCSAEFAAAFPASNYAGCSTEEALFEQAGIPFIPDYLREDPSIISRIQKQPLPALIEPGDIRGIIHSHSNWSDGSNTIEEMAMAAQERGLEYLVISDHSKSAFYASGLSEERIREQHRYIDELNSRLAPFRIFKSIESDILNDGSLDYSDAILSTFDLVIASVHSNLKMSQDKAMSRILKAIENPYTSILGHMTGRLLLSRNGYPVDHRLIIDACAANGVVIELNAHPSRLDIDWRHIGYALEKGVMISINPDAHVIEGFDDTRYGVLAARKAMVTPEQNLSSCNLEAFTRFVEQQHSKRR